MIINHSKDVLLICKGHYNKEKYDSPISALKAYQSEYSGCEEKYITDRLVFNIILNVAKEFFTPFNWYWLFRDGFANDIELANSGLMPTYYLNNKVELSYQYLINKFVIALSLLGIKDENDNWIIDLSEYNDIGNVI